MRYENFQGDQKRGWFGVFWGLVVIFLQSLLCFFCGCLVLSVVCNWIMIVMESYYYYYFFLAFFFPSFFPLPLTSLSTTEKNLFAVLTQLFTTLRTPSGNLKMEVSLSSISTTTLQIMPTASLLCQLLTIRLDLF